MGTRNHAFHDEKDALGESEICRPNQIRRMDSRWKTPRACIFGNARRQRCAEGYPRKVNRGRRGLSPTELPECEDMDGQACEGSSGACGLRADQLTRDGKLGAPVFLALREDKKSTDVVREG